MRRYRSESGQTVVVLVFFLFVMILLAGAVMDVGAWFRADRQLQNVADAAVLAAAQELPQDPGVATTTAISYASKNGGSLSAGNIKFSRNDDRQRHGGGRQSATVRRRSSPSSLGSRPSRSVLRQRLAPRRWARRSTSLRSRSTLSIRCSNAVRSPASTGYDPRSHEDRPRCLSSSESRRHKGRNRSADSRRLDPQRLQRATCRSTGTSKTRARSSMQVAGEGGDERPPWIRASLSQSTTRSQVAAQTSSITSSDGSDSFRPASRPTEAQGKSTAISLK